MKTNRLKILLIVPPNREDFYRYLQEAENTDFYILWFVHKKEGAHLTLPAFIKGQYFWEDYRTPKELLQNIQPSRIVFFELIDQRQIALIITANYYKHPNFYLEHGAAGDKETAQKRSEHHKVKYFFSRLPLIFKRFFTSIADVVRVKYFYYSALTFVSRPNRTKFLKLPILTLFSKPNKVLSACIFHERVPGKCILFNQVNFEEFHDYTGVSEEKAVMEGVPFFDKFYTHQTNNTGPIVYIEHPYLEEGLCNWSEEHHKKLAWKLHEFAEKSKEKIIVKLHPRSSRVLWDSYQLPDTWLQIEQHGDLLQAYLASKLILGFSSSLINGFLCARKNIVLLGWHPQPHIFGADFSATGLCHVSFSSDDLLVKYPEWVQHNPTFENEIAYQAFLKKFNYPFDGRATARVIGTITNNEIS